MEFPHPNVLGSETAFTNYSGALVNDRQYYPWGQDWTQVGTMERVFAGMLNDDALWYTQYRRYSPILAHDSHSWSPRSSSTSQRPQYGLTTIPLAVQLGSL